MLVSIAEGFDRFIRWFVNASPETTRIEPLASRPRRAWHGAAAPMKWAAGRYENGATAGSSKRGLS